MSINFYWGSHKVSLVHIMFKIPEEGCILRFSKATSTQGEKLFIVK